MIADRLSAATKNIDWFCSSLEARTVIARSQEFSGRNMAYPAKA